MAMRESGTDRHEARRTTVLVAGGTGTLGTRIVRLLTARGLPVRVLTRDAARARPLEGSGVEIVRRDYARA
jgi:uncharacterized protein YbjT (DUF2867 family)